MDGADSLSNLYSYYFGDKINGFQCPNYFKKFTSYGTAIKNPTIFIFDNEINSAKEKPINKFKGYINLSKEEKKIFAQAHKIKLKENGSFYLVTNQLINGAKESEIEDLFDKSVLKVKIDNRTFDRKVGKSDSKHFGKNTFSKYVIGNYNDINFDNFIPMLDNICEIVSEYKEVAQD